MAFIRRIKRGNYTYLAEVENRWTNGKVIQKHIRYVGKEVNDKKILSGSVEDSEISQVKLWAPLIVLNSLAKEIRLSRILGDYGDYLLCLAYAHCLEPKSLNKMEEWFTRTDLDKVLDIKDISEKKLYSALDSINDVDSEKIQKRIFESLQERYDLKPKSHFFDVTNAYFYGAECPMAKLGKSKAGLDKPQIQIGLAVTEEEGLPIFHKTFDGNIFDARILNDMMVSFSKLNIKDIFIVWDRGVSSMENIEDAKKAGFDVICGLANKKNVKPLFDGLIKQGGFIEIKNRVRLKNAIFYCKSRKYKYGKITGKLVICFNEEAARIKRERRLDRINEAKLLAKEGKLIPEGMEEYLISGELNEKLIKEEQKYDGYSMIFCTKNLPVEEIVKPYFEKDKIEKAFRSMKSILGLQPIRHWLEERVKSHVFVCYVSYLLLSMLEYKLKKMDLTAVDALDKLSTAYKVYLKNNKTKNEFEKLVTLTKEQQKILNCVDKSIMHSVHK